VDKSIVVLSGKIPINSIDDDENETSPTIPKEATTALNSKSNDVSKNPPIAHKRKKTAANQVKSRRGKKKLISMDLTAEYNEDEGRKGIQKIPDKEVARKEDEKDTEIRLKEFERMKKSISKEHPELLKDSIINEYAEYNEVTK
jgi:hypothetical protein